MQFYSKLIAVIVGLLVMLASRYFPGIDLEKDQQMVIDTVTAIVTSFIVYWAQNKPVTPEQVEVREVQLSKAKADMHEKQLGKM